MELGRKYTRACAVGWRSGGAAVAARRCEEEVALHMRVGQCSKPCVTRTGREVAQLGQPIGEAARALGSIPPERVHCDLLQSLCCCCCTGLASPECRCRGLPVIHPSLGIYTARERLKGWGRESGALCLLFEKCSGPCVTRTGA